MSRATWSDIFKLVLSSLLIATTTQDNNGYFDVFTINDVALVSTEEFVDFYVPDVSSSSSSSSSDSSSSDNAYDSRFAVIVLLPGGNVDRKLYSIISNFLASKGFIVAVPQITITVFGDVSLLIPRQDSVNHTIDKLIELNNDEFSILYNIVDSNNIVLFGHSLGGFIGARVLDGPCGLPPNVYCDTIIPYTDPSGIKAGLFFGSLLIDEDRPPVIPAINLTNNYAAIGYIVASEDIITPPEKTQITYDWLVNNYNTFDISSLTIDGINHFGITDSPQRDQAQTLTQEEGLEIIGELALKYFKIYLFNNEDIWQQLYDDSDSDSDSDDDTLFVNGVSQILSQPCQVDCLFDF